MEQIMVMIPLPDDDLQMDTTYRSQGVHKNRDNTAKMAVDPMDRNGVTDSDKQAIMEAAAAATADNMEPQTISVDERPRPRPDVASEVVSESHATAAAATSRVEPGSYRLPTPGMGSPSSYGDGPPPGSSSGGGGMNLSVDASSFMGEGGEGGMAAMGGSMGGGGGGGGGMMSGLPQMIGQDTAAIDDEVDQATEALFQDDTVRMAHQRMGEKLQGR